MTMIKYITRAEMESKFSANYFGLTQHYSGSRPKIYIQKHLPKCVQESVLAHEKHHAKGNHGEFGAWIAGFKGNWKGFFLGIILSLTPSRLKMYPELVSFIALVAAFSSLAYFGSN